MNLILMGLREPSYTLMYPELGIGYIASYIKKYSNYDTDIKIIDRIKSEDEVLKKIKGADLIGISSTTFEFLRARRLANKIKQQMDIPIIIGGVHISALNNHLPKEFDIGVIGEGEQTMLELLNLYNKKTDFSYEHLKNIKGIIHNKSGKTIFTGTRGLIYPVDKIPPPARDLYDMKFYLKKHTHSPGTRGKGTSLMTSRGCPYNCVFCHSCRFWGGVRFHSPKYVINEIKELVDKYNVKYLNIFDDLFIANKKRLKEIVQFIQKEKINEKVKFCCQARANLFNKEVGGLLKKMNMGYINFGLESGSEKILNYLKKGTVTVEDNKNAVKIANQFGFKISSGFMIGNPNERVEDLNQTYNFIKNNPLDIIRIFITTPLPGTELWQYAKNKNIVSDDMDWEKINQLYNGNNVVLSDIDKTLFQKIHLKLLIMANISMIKKSKKKIYTFLKGVTYNFLVNPKLIKNPRLIPNYIKYWISSLKNNQNLLMK